MCGECCAQRERERARFVRIRHCCIAWSDILRCASAAMGV